MSSANNVVDIKDAPGPLAMILRRRVEIKMRREELSALVARSYEESNALYNEDRDLQQAEKTLRKLLDR